MKPRSVFFGTPAFAVPTLDALLGVADVRAVVAQPDRPSGRGRVVEHAPVKRRALEVGIPVLQPERVRTPELAETLRAFEADVFVVVAYGRILPAGLLAIPPRGCVNVHASLLPRHRGAAPVQWAIRSGDRVSGVTLMLLDEGMDTGPTLSARETPIGGDETAGELSERLARLGADLLRDDLPRWMRAELAAVPQDAAGATAAPPLRKEEGVVDWSRPADAVHDHVRAMNPWPGAVTTLGGKPLKLHRSRHLPNSVPNGAPPGAVIAVTADGVVVACGTGALCVTEAQLEGRRRMPAAELARGLRLAVGVQLG